MNATVCEVEIGKTATPVLTPGLYSRMGIAPQQRRCPFCDSVIYSRRHKLCGVCSRELPASVLFDEHQSHHVTVLLQEERQRHRSWLQRFSFQN